MFIDEQRKIQVKRKYDVAVCGGGIAGISAALAAARHGCRVCLFEKQYMLGGLGTAGLVTIYLPLCDGLGHQVSFGIPEELLRLSVLHGAEGRYPENWLENKGTRLLEDKRFEVQYNPQLFAILAEKLLLDEGVDILYGTYVVGVKVDNEKIDYIIAENKSGRYAYKVNSVVDATGDCDIAHFSNVPTKTFKQGNVLAAWYYSVGNDGYKLNMIGYADIPDEEKDTVGKTFGERAFFGMDGDKTSEKRFSGLDGEEISEQMCMSHSSTYADFLEKRKKDNSYFPVTVASIPQIRMTRKIVGEHEMLHTDDHKYFEDSVGMVSNWKKRGPVYEVPFGALYNAEIKNLICAGRCISANETMWDIMRVIPCCAVTGQAAGTAASMTDDFSCINITELQKKLIADGVVLHEDDLK